LDNEKSPCLSCDHKDRNKNHPDCINCSKRLIFMGLKPPSKEDVEESNKIVCKRCKVPKVEEDFQNSVTSKTGKMGVCKICLVELREEGRKKKKEKKRKEALIELDKISDKINPKTEEKIEDKVDKLVKEIKSKNSPTSIIDELFQDYPETLQYIKSEAFDNVRSPEQHVVHLIKLFADNDMEFKMEMAKRKKGKIL
jgi:hypothetical protein